MLENNEKNLAQLLEELHLSDDYLPDEKIKKLTKIENYAKDEAVKVLNYLITQEKDPQVLHYIIKNISKHNDDRSYDYLIDLLLFKEQYQENLKSPDEYLKVRCLVANTLGNLRNNNAVVPLLYILNNKNENYKLRLTAAEALGRIGDQYAVSPLIEIVSNEEEKSIYLRESAAKALGMLNDIRAIDPLIRILETKKGIVDKFTFLKEKIIEAIGQIGYKDDKTFKVLSNSLLDESPYIRLSAIEALSELNDNRTLDLIIPMIKDSEEDVARGAIDAIYNIAGREYLANLYDQPDLAGWCKDEIETILEENSEENE